MQPHERLEVYGLALDFVEEVEGILRGLPRRGLAAGDQLDRAATSVVMNIAEGAGEFAPKEKARIYRIALRSALECSAALDDMHRRKRIPASVHEAARSHLAPISAMLTRLIHRFT